MPSLRLFRAQFLSRIVARFHAWKERRRPVVTLPAAAFFHFPNGSQIHREVSANGVRVYSLCGDCGLQLQASATLCDECAQKRSRPARPY
jgi:hypothetical protein